MSGLDVLLPEEDVPAPPGRRSLQAPPRARHARPVPLQPATPTAWLTPGLTSLGLGMLMTALVVFGSTTWSELSSPEPEFDALALAPSDQAGLPVGPVQVTAPTSPPTTVVEGATQPAVAGVPVTLGIPSIKVGVAIKPIGLNAKQEILPAFGEAAWFTLGPTPGNPGHAVIAAHVDSYKGPDVFYRLRELKPGEDVSVQMSSGPLSFKVDSLEEVPKQDLGKSAVWQPTDRPRLALITCGGKFDKKSRSYAKNVIVYATLVAPVAPPELILGSDAPGSVSPAQSQAQPPAELILGSDAPGSVSPAQSQAQPQAS